MVKWRTKEINDISLAQHFASKFLIQFAYQETFQREQVYLLLFIYVSAMQMFYLYTMYVLKSITLV